MRTRTSIAINGVWLHDVDPRILVQEINEGQPRINPRALSTVGGMGQQLASIRRETLDITVTFGIMGHYDLAGRAEVLEKVSAWAASGSNVTVDYRPGRVLHAVCIQYPGLGVAGAWNGSMSLILRAYEEPYWQDAEPTSASWQAAAADIPITVHGNMDTVLDASIRCGDQPVGSIAIACGSSSMVLDGLDMQPGQTLTISHTAGLLAIRMAGESILHKRTPDSSDEIILHPGSNTVTVEADASCSITITARGRYL